MKYKLASESCIIEFAFVEFIRYCQKFFQNDFTNLYLSIVAFILPVSSNGNLVLWMYYSFTIFCCHWDIYCQSNLVGIYFSYFYKFYVSFAVLLKNFWEFCRILTPECTYLALVLVNPQIASLTYNSFSTKFLLYRILAYSFSNVS